MSETVLVTGAAGFVGSHLLAALNETEPGVEVVAWRRPGAAVPAELPRAFGDTSSVRWQAVDLLDREAVIRGIAESRPMVIYHCGGVANVHGSWSTTLATLEANVRGTQNLLDAVGRSGLSPRILIPGSALVYKPSTHAITEDDALGPVSPYALSKLAQEMLGQRVAEEGQAVLLARAFTHIGPGQELSYAASSFAHQVARIEAGQQEPVINVGYLDARRDLTDVRDTVGAYQALMARAVPGRPYNVCTGRAPEIRDVLDGLQRHATVEVCVQVDPSRLRPSDNPLLLGDPARITEEIGWHPAIPLEQTLRDLLDYWRGAIRH